MSDEARLRARRRCKHCGGKIPPELRLDAKYCSPKHKSAASRTTPAFLEKKALSAPRPVPQLAPPPVVPPPAPAPEPPVDPAQIVLGRLQQLRRDAGQPALVPQPALAALALRQAAEALIMLALRVSFPQQRDRLLAPDADDIGETGAMREMRRLFPERHMTYGLLPLSALPRMNASVETSPPCELVGVSVLLHGQIAIVVVIQAPRPPVDQPVGP